MTTYTIPDSWLESLGGTDRSGWLTEFDTSPKKALADLLWDEYYFGPLNVVDGFQLLENWIERLGDKDDFAAHLDKELTDWVEENWEKYDRNAKSLASAWSCLSAVVAFSHNLPKESHLKQCAIALRKKFDRHKMFLGSFSTAPSEDPLGLYLEAIAEFQENDRSLAPFWHRLCDLPYNVPFYHARYAMLGLRRLNAANPNENGILREEIVSGLLQLVRAFDRLATENVLPEKIAKDTFRRVALQTTAAFPGSPGWYNNDLVWPYRLPIRAKSWLYEAVPQMEVKVRNVENTQTIHTGISKPKSAIPDPNWADRVKTLIDDFKKGKNALPKVKILLGEQRRYAETTGNANFLVLSLCNFAKQVQNSDSVNALIWAKEANDWEPSDPYTWAIIKDILLTKKRLDDALRYSWVAWKRFPYDVVARNGLAEVLKATHRYPEAEKVYRDTIILFPKAVDTHCGLAEVLKAIRRYPEAEKVYRDIIPNIKDNKQLVIARNGLADTLARMGRLQEAETEYRDINSCNLADHVSFIGLAFLLCRKGESCYIEAIKLAQKTLYLDPGNSYARTLIKVLKSKSSVEISQLLENWRKDLEKSIVELPAIQKQSSANESEIVSGIVNEESEGTYLLQSQSSLEALELSALVAEAYFYRIWAKGVDVTAKKHYLNKASSLIKKAEGFAPMDLQVLAERYNINLELDENNEQVYKDLSNQLNNHPAAVSLMVLNARLDRENAKKEKRKLNQNTQDELFAIPQRLFETNPNTAPLYHFQKGLASLALLDGAVRADNAAHSFNRFRSAMIRIAHDYSGEIKKTENALFHDWIFNQSNKLFFNNLKKGENVLIKNIPEIEKAMEERYSNVIEIEDMFADRFAFSTV